MKIVKLTCENFKRLVAVEIEPDGNTVLITGKNGAGKSSVLDAICAALCGKKYHPDKPIRSGEDHAEVVVETENYIIKRTFTESGGGSVKITNADGMVAQSSQTLLDKIVGKIAFDPMSFIAMGKTEAGKKEQRTKLMELTGLDFGDIDIKIADVKDDRSNVRRDKERLELEAEQCHVIEIKEGSIPDEEVSVAELAAELQKTVELNAVQDVIVRDIDAMKSNILQSNNCIQLRVDQIADLNNQLGDAEKALKADREQLASFKQRKTKLIAGMKEKIDTVPISQKMGEVEATNELVRNEKRKTELLSQAKAKGAEYSKLLKKMKTLEASKATLLADAEMPLEGLSVDDNGVIFFDKKVKAWIPLSQVNDAGKLEIGMGIAMAENPTLRVIRMNGNDLDEDSLKIVEAMAKDKDYQLWIERWAEGEGGIIIEDGMVK